MVDSYAGRRARQVPRLLGRVEAGERLADIWRDPDMPSSGTVMKWRRKDAAFSAAFDRALAIGRWRRTWMFDEALADALLARFRSGEHLADLLKDPAMPGRAQYDYWRATQAPFCAEIERLKTERQAQRNRDVRQRTKAAFDPAVADRIIARMLRGAWLREVLASDPALPSVGVVWRWRRESPEFDRALRDAVRSNRTRRLLSRRHRQEVEDFVVARIEAGETLASLAARRDLPNRDTLHRWMREQPAFAARIEAARKARRNPEIRAARRRQIMQAARRRMAEIGRRTPAPRERS